MQDSGHTPAWTGQTVERTRSNGKRVFTTAFKRWIVEQASAPGVSVAGLAMRHEVNANQLRRWMRLERVGGKPSLPVLLPVTVMSGRVEPAVAASVASDATLDAHIEIELGDAIVRLGRGAHLADLRMVVQALRS